MGDLKFVPQSMLDLWADLGKIELAGETLKIPAENVSFQLTPAVRFMSVLEGEDTHKLVTKVKPHSFVKEIGGEVMDDSCLVGETAYQVQGGFLADTDDLARAQSSKATKKPLPKPAGAVAGTPSIPPAPRPPAPAAPASAAPAPAAAAPARPGEKKDDADLLTRFLLDSLDQQSR